MKQSWLNNKPCALLEGPRFLRPRGKKSRPLRETCKIGLMAHLGFEIEAVPDERHIPPFLRVSQRLEGNIFKAKIKLMLPSAARVGE